MLFRSPAFFVLDQHITTISEAQVPHLFIFMSVKISNCCRETLMSHVHLIVFCFCFFCVCFIGLRCTKTSVQLTAPLHSIRSVLAYGRSHRWVGGGRVRLAVLLGKTAKGTCSWQHFVFLYVLFFYPLVSLMVSACVFAYIMVYLTTKYQVYIYVRGPSYIQYLYLKFIQDDSN